jgi:demethylmenaquinone methyltransferase/2-methoxy-6-polyprenyl-1,4-benzoquinol methylase
MFDAIAPRYDAVNKAMSFGLDIYWRRRTAGLLGLGEGAFVLDLACGTGDFIRELTRRAKVPVGIDLSAGMLASARVDGAPLLLGDALAMPFASASFDGVVSGFALRNFTDLPGVFGELARVVRTGGRVALMDIAQPTGLVLKLGYRLWFNTVVPAIGGAVSDKAAYRYLPRSVAYLPEPEELMALLAQAGFGDVARLPLSGGIVQVLSGTRL